MRMSWPGQMGTRFMAYVAIKLKDIGCGGVGCRDSTTFHEGVSVMGL